ncbi:hypothetical protein GCM10028807_41710 [Spirosoma daeguense]
MKPIRFFRYQDAVWYNLEDYIGLLQTSQTVWPVRRSSLTKRRRHPTPISDVVRSKLNRLRPTYQIWIDGTLYVDGAIFERLDSVIKPFLVHPDDWKNPDSLFRQLQIGISPTKRIVQLLDPATTETYFEEIVPKGIADKRD